MTWANSLPMQHEAMELTNHLTNMYYDIRFGGHRLGRSQRIELMHSVRLLESLLRKGIS